MKPIYYRPKSKDDCRTVEEVFDELVYKPNWFLFKPEDIRRVVDIGAFIGSFTLWALEQWPKAVIHAYEPDPDNYSFLLKNIHAVDTDQRVKPYNLAVWKNDTKLTLYTHKLSPGDNSVIYAQQHYAPDRAETIEVQSRSMANVMDEIGGNIDYLKIDCEGAEYEILFSLSMEMLRRIKCLTVEFHNFNLELMKDPHKLTEYLRKAGFVTQIVPKGFGTGMEHGYIYAGRIGGDSALFNAAFDDEEDRLLKMVQVDNVKTRAMKEKDEYNNSLLNSLGEKETYNESLMKTLREKETTINELNDALQFKDNQVQLVEEEITFLKERVSLLENSFGIKLTRFYGPKIIKYFPDGTVHGRFIKMAISVARTIAEEGFSSFLNRRVKNMITRIRRKRETEISLKCLSLASDNNITTVDSSLGNSPNLRSEYLIDHAKNSEQHLLNIAAKTEDSSLRSVEGKFHVESVPQDTHYDTAVCTIASKNYFAFARAFADSYLKHNPNGKVFLLLVDEVDGYFKPQSEKFEIIRVRDLMIPNFEIFSFKYNVLELCTSVKPYFLDYLIRTYNVKKLAYFDPDILITSSLTDLFALLDNYSIILTTHLLESVDDGYKPDEFEILKAGIFNLGFIAVRNDRSTSSFLNWWQKKLYNFSVMDPNKGYHADQRWIDLVPGLFDNVYILREPGYNVAYWNLSGRLVTNRDGKFYVNDKPMYFFHFSGFDPDNIDMISKHQNRFTLNKLPNLKPLFEMYKDLLLANGHKETRKWPCVFEYFDNGVRIPEVAKKMLYELGEEARIFGNPYLTDDPKCFFNWLRASVERRSGAKPIARLWLGLYKFRPDIQRAYRDLFGENRDGFIEWVRNSSIREHNIDAKFLQPLDYSDPTWEKADSKMLNTNVRLFARGTTQLQATVAKNPKKLTNECETKNKMQFGVNYAGYLTGEFGIAESSRAFAHALQAVNIPHVLINVTSNAHRNLDSTFTEFSDNNPYNVNLIHVNADVASNFYRERKKKFFQNRYNVGIWYWELDTLPQVFWESFRYYDEIWATSDFTAQAISKVSPVPVIKIPHPFYFDVRDSDSNKLRFELTDDDYIFLFLFDFYSIFERKNPLGLIKAFRNAFKKEENAVLVINCISSQVNPRALKEMKEASASLNVKILDGHLSRKDYKSLMKISNCYVSLHRSEGFGIVMAQAMYLNKPVIATAYSGNMEFMNVNNSFLVKYDLVELERDYGPYKKGNVWAEPEIDHAAQLMRLVYEDRQLANRIAERGSADIQRFNPARTGYAILNRLERIKSIK